MNAISNTVYTKLRCDVLNYPVWFVFDSADKAFEELSPTHQIGDSWYQLNDSLPASRWINIGIKLITTAEINLGFN